MWQEKYHCHINKSHLIADVTETFFLPHQPQSLQRGVKQICQYCKGHSQIIIFVSGKIKYAYIT
jgi:hypothetical protein